MKVSKVFVYLLLFFSFAAFSQERVVTAHVSPTLKFTENKGQWDHFIKYRAQLDGGLLFLQDDGLTFNLYDKKKYRSLHTGGAAKDNDLSIKCHAFKVEFVGCNKKFENVSSEEGSDYENFYIGNDPSKWKGYLHNYHRILYKELYEKIDYEALTTTQGIKYNFYLKPGADANKIQLKYEGVDKLKISNGELVIGTSVKEIRERKPYAFQNINGKIVEVPCKFNLKDKVVTFDFPKGYDANYELVIDPVLVFAAQSGSTADNFGMTATYDAAGNLISGGTVFDNGFPTTLGAYSTTFGGVPAPGNTDVIITKYNTTGTAQIFSTYLGGVGSEIVTSLIVDASGNLFLYGATGSSNFPVTGGAYDNSFNGGNYMNFVFNGTEFMNGTDIYVSKFNSTGTALLGSTFLGGSANDGVNHTNALVTYTATTCGWTGVLTEYKADSLQYNYGDQYRGEITLDKNGDVYIASSTRSNNFPIVGGFDNTLGGKQDAIVAKFNPTLTSLLWSSYLGGSLNDAGYSLIVDDSLQVFVTGGTFSVDFPTKAGCYKTTYQGGKADGYIAKINSTGSAILKATYIGTSNYDQSYFIQSDRAGKIYVYGQSLGAMPVTAGVYSNPGSHQFITRLDRQLNNVNMGTVFGTGAPKIDISPAAFSVDKCTGTINLSGWGGNFISCILLNGMPTTPGAFQTTSPNNFDFYVMSLAPNAISLRYASYFGGNLSEEHVDGGTSRFSESGQLYQSVCAGCGGNDDFPVTPGAWPGTPGNPNHALNCNNGVFKFDMQPKVTAAIGTNTISGCQNLTVNFANLSSPGLPYLWNLGGGPNDTTSQVLNPVKTFTNPGTYTVTLMVYENVYCFTKDSAKTIIIVYPKINANFTYSIVPCSDSVKFTNTSVTTATAQTSNWTFGDATSSTTLNPIHTYTASGTYTVTLIASTGFCSDTIKKPVTVALFNPFAANGGAFCYGQSTTTLSASGGTSYSWQPSATLSSSIIPNPVASPTTTTIYSVTITNSVSGCAATLTTQVTVNPKPIADFTFTMNLCGGGVNYFDASTFSITAWQWSLGNAQTSTLQNPYLFYPSGGTYTIDLIVTNIFGCKDTVNKPITVSAPPPVSVSSNTNMCVGGYVQLNATGGYAYQWSPASSLSGTNVPNPIASPSVTTNYTVTIFTVNGIGDSCKLVLNTTVNVNQVSAIPVAVAANPDTVVKGNSSILTVTVSPGATATWFPASSTFPQTGYTVTTVPQHTTTYTVVLTRGLCTETLTVTVWVIEDGCGDADVFVPNTFTPNGDGVNDIMYARGYKITEIYFAIYNRWGEMVFETRDKNVGWDGVYKNRPADVGVFGYYVKVKCYNGLETFKKGNITLIR